MDKYILSKTEIDTLPGTDKTHFLNSNARRNNKSLGDLTGLENIGFHLIEVKPGDWSTETHVHHFEEECVYILEGQADARIGSQTFHVGAGDFIGYRAGGEPHTLRNTGNAVLKCLVVGQRLEHDVCDYPDLGKRLYRNKGSRWNLVDQKDIVEPDRG